MPSVSPRSLAIGGAEFDPSSPWWVFEHLQRLVARAPGSAAFVRTAFAELQLDLLRRNRRRRITGRQHLAAGNETEAIATLRALVDSTTDRALILARQLTTELPLQPGYAPILELSDFWNQRDAFVMPTPNPV